MLLELSDLCFFVKSLKLHESPNQSFNISEHVSFSHNNTRSGTFNKLIQPPIKHNRDKQFYFYRLPHLWNSLATSHRPKFIIHNNQKAINQYLLEVVSHKIQSRCQLLLLLCLSMPKMLLPAKVPLQLTGPRSYNNF